MTLESKMSPFANGYVYDRTVGSVLYVHSLITIPPMIQDLLTADDYILQDRQHITMLPRSVGSLVTTEIADVIEQQVKSWPVPQVEASDVLYELHAPKESEGIEHDRYSVVAVVDSEDLESAHDRLRTILPQLQPTLLHITIAHKGDELLEFKGIGVDSRVEWKQLRPLPYATLPEKVAILPL